MGRDRKETAGGLKGILRLKVRRRLDENKMIFDGEIRESSHLRICHFLFTPFSISSLADSICVYMYLSQTTSTSEGLIHVSFSVERYPYTFPCSLLNVADGERFVIFVFGPVC